MAFNMASLLEALDEEEAPMSLPTVCDLLRGLTRAPHRLPLAGNRLPLEGNPVWCRHQLLSTSHHASHTTRLPLAYPFTYTPLSYQSFASFTT